MRSFFTALIALAAFGLNGTFAVASPVDDVTQAQNAFLAVRSVHFDISTRDGKHISIGMIKPDRYSGILVNNTRAIIIGSTVWVMRNGKWQVDASARGSSGDYLESARMPLDGRPAHQYAVADLGASNVGGSPARHYRLTRAGSSAVKELWVGPNHMLLRLQNTTSRGTSVVLYSQYNSVPPINPPM